MLDDMKVMVIDFENRDDYIGAKLGAGWAYHNDKSGKYKFEPLCAATIDYKGYSRIDEGFFDYMTNTIPEHDVIVAHNAQYDIGTLYHIVHNLDTLLKDKLIIDTQILAKLYDNRLFKYNLDTLASKYLKINKGTDILAKLVYKFDLLPYIKKELEEKNKAEKLGLPYTRPFDEKKLLKCAYRNMGELYRLGSSSIKEYALKDVEICNELFKFFMQEMGDQITLTQLRDYSDLIKASVQSVYRGVQVDISKAATISDKLSDKIKETEATLEKEAGGTLNPNSSKQIAEYLKSVNIKFNKTDKGNPNIDAEFLENQKDIVCQNIVNLRKLKKVKNDFIDKIIDIASLSGDPKVGTIHPEVNILAARTGRFSSGCPNIQQITRSGTELGDMCRSIFIPFEGERWYSLDYSSQEIRVLVHYASALQCRGVQDIVQKYKENPNLDFHTTSSKLCNIDRSSAKAIILGIMYGMGVKTLSENLNIDFNEANRLKGKFLKVLPFLEEINNRCKRVFKLRKNIKTLGGRVIRLERPTKIGGELRTFEYKALNALIQGSSADMTIRALADCYRAGIPVLFSVHDQICISAKDSDTAAKVQHIMENAYNMEVPLVVDVDLEGGENWTESGH